MWSLLSFPSVRVDNVRDHLIRRTFRRRLLRQCILQDICRGEFILHGFRVTFFAISLRLCQHDGLCHVTSGACGRWWEALWNRWPNFFKYRRRVREAVFVCLNDVYLRKVSWIFICKRSLAITETVVAIFFKLLQLQKSKNPATSCIQISLNRTPLRMCPSWQR